MRKSFVPARFPRCALAALLFGIAAPAAFGADTGTLTDVTFTEYTPLSSNAELARRMLSPLTAAQIPRLLEQSGKKLAEQPVNLADEKFALYVPAREPSTGYALLVFVAPWDSAKLPDGWAPLLDQYGTIFVTPARAGNEMNMLARREPLALLAEQNVAHRYRIDPEHVFIGGFSGGSRVAMRLALGYPDVFRGAILNAGSDLIGTAETPLPPRDLFQQFQEFSHIVFATGERDNVNLSSDRATMHSMRDWCVFNTDEHFSPYVTHEIVSTAVLSQALDSLFHPAPPDAAKLAACRSAVESELSAKLAQVESLIAAGQSDSAGEQLKDIDGRFGGLAAPRSVELEERLHGSTSSP
ncbi:MAG TPA: PHB depolymerase family esterase [Rhizomicrobium sp.]|jgi:hypothetical protein